MSVVGLKSVLITASAMSAMRGANSTPYNVAIVLDSTLSMNLQDTNCGDTQMNCALSGVRILLQSLSPCAASHSTCTFTNGVAADPVDQVALFSFPNVTVGSASINTKLPYTNYVVGFERLLPRFESWLLFHAQPDGMERYGTGHGLYVPELFRSGL